MSRESARARARARTNVSKYRFRTSDPSGFGGVEPMQQLSSNRQLTSTVRIAIGLPERLLLLLLPPPCIAKANECAEVCVHSKEALPPPTSNTIAVIAVCLIIDIRHHIVGAAGAVRVVQT